MKEMADVHIIRQLEILLNRDIKEEKGIFRYTESYSKNDKGAVIGLKITNRHKLPQAIIREIVTTIGELRNLIYLDLANNEITDIGSLNKLQKLKYLDLSNNHISEIEALGDLLELNCLALSKNKIVNIKPLLNCRKLSFLFLQKNQIQEAPYEILTNIIFNVKEYNLIQAQFAKSSFVNLKQFEEAAASRDLEKIMVESGRQSLSIQDLPEYTKRSIAEHFKIEFISENPLINPPFDIIKQGQTAIRNYFDQINKEEGKTQRLFEAKLLVIGEGGTGKTTFIRKIKNENAEMPEERDTTLGIEVGAWTYMIDFPVDKKLIKVKFHVNLWDFGGQRIYQGTHQMFFSEKSFYVLVADTREQKTDFSYWLNTVEQLGGDSSSLVIVLNKKYGHEQRFDESGYTKHFGKLIKKVVQLDLKKDIDDIGILQYLIKTFLKQLPGIGDILPMSWVKIREELSNERVNFISFDRFREICSQYKIKDLNSIRTISEYFNRIGVFTHYIDDILLQERIYLNSNWLVKTLYEVLDNETAKSKKGRLSISDIKKIWGTNELQYEVNKLVQLMNKFGLMYHTSDADEYVVPAHLLTEMPYSEWPHSKKDQILQFIYEFDKFMPQGIMSRLIVSLHHHIKDHNHVWHKGVNLECNGAYAEIQEAYKGNNQFDIRIAGINKIELLAIIRERFGEVLKPFNKLNFKQLVPCVCDECIDSATPAFHDYNLLLKFREKGTGSQCSKTGEIISAEKLLKITEIKKEKNSLPPKGFAIRTIKIFLASSSELSQDRQALREFISVENDMYHEAGIYLKIIQWEYFIDAMSKKRLQEEYNKSLKESDIFLSLFFTKVGRYTSEEFENAFGQFKSTGKPYIYTYFKDAPVNYNQIKKDDISSKFKFENKLKSLGHFKTIYKNTDDLTNQFKRQLEILIPKLCS